MLLSLEDEGKANKVDFIASRVARSKAFSELGSSNVKYNPDTAREWAIIDWEALLSAREAEAARAAAAEKRSLGGKKSKRKSKYNIKMVRRTKRTKKRTKQSGGRNNVGWYKNFNNIAGRSEIVRYDGCKQPVVPSIDKAFLTASGVKPGLVGGRRRRRSRRTSRRSRRTSRSKKRRTRKGGKRRSRN